MANAEHIETKSSGFQILSEEQKEASRIIASVLLLGLEDSSVTEGFTENELAHLRKDIAARHLTGDLGRRIGEISNEEGSILSGKSPK